MSVPTYPPYPTQVTPTHLPVTCVSFSATTVATATTVIYSGQSLSSLIDMTQPSLFGFLPLAVILPSAWTTARLSFQASYDGVTFGELHTFSSGHYTTSAAGVATDIYQIDGYPLRGIPFFKIRSGLVGAPVVQAADRVITIICGTY